MRRILSGSQCPRGEVPPVTRDDVNDVLGQVREVVEAGRTVLASGSVQSFVA